MGRSPDTTRTLTPPPLPQDPAPRRPRRVSWRRWLHRRQSVLILAALLLLIVVSPIEDYWRHSDLLLAPTVVLVVLASVHHSRAGRPVFYLTSILALGWLATLPSIALLAIGTLGSHVLMLGMNIVMLVMMARQIMQAKEPHWGTVSAALSGYLLIAVIWSHLYVAIALLAPGAFATAGATGARDDTLLYFSLQTITTLGFGDITPVNPFVRMLATVEAIGGQFYIATVIARLVSLARPRAYDD